MVRQKADASNEKRLVPKEVRGELRGPAFRHPGGRASAGRHGARWRHLPAHPTAARR